MANNYLQFSLSFKLKNGKEKAWCNDHLGLMEKIHDECDKFNIDPSEHPRSDEYNKFLEDYDLMGDESGLDINWYINDDVMYIDSGYESGNADHAAIFVQKFLALFDKDSGIGFCYSTTCDKLRVDQFGGGAFFVTAEQIKHIDSYQWLEDRRFDHMPKKGRGRQYEG